MLMNDDKRQLYQGKKSQMVNFKKQKLRLRGFKHRFIFFQMQADIYWKTKYKIENSVWLDSLTHKNS